MPFSAGVSRWEWKFTDPEAPNIERISVLGTVEAKLAASQTG